MNIEVPIKEIFNEYYPAQVSQKVRAVKRLMAEQGHFCNSRAPYGYQKSEKDRHIKTNSFEPRNTIMEDNFVRKTSKNDNGKITKIPLAELYPPDFHPFNVNDDEAMSALAESIKQYGVREPGLVRKREDGGYELLCGNRRKRACEIAEIDTLPVIICELDDDNAVIAMVDSNLQRRESLLPSEKAWAYRVKMEALKHGGIKGDCHSYQVMVEQTGESKNQIFRTIRLTELVPALADMADMKQIAFNPAVELSYLSRKEQAVVAEVIATCGIKPSLSQAVQLKKLKQSGKLTADVINRVLSEEKKTIKGERTERYRRFFPTGYSEKQIDTVIVSLLSEWKLELSNAK